MNNFGTYRFKITKDPHSNHWCYKIYTDDYKYIWKHDTNIIIDSPELFCSENIARIAAIGHIALIEEGPAVAS